MKNGDENMNTIIMNKILMHMLDFEHKKIHLSESFVDLNETNQEYYRKKVEKALYSTQLKELTVGSLHEMILRGDKFIESEDEFKNQAKKMSEKFFALGSLIEEMPNCNLIYVDCYMDGVHKIAAIKLNYKYAPVSVVEEGNVRITRRQILPAAGAGIDEAIVIDVDHKKLAIIEKKYMIDGKMDTYLNSQWIKGEEKLTDKQKYNTMKKVIAKMDDIYHVNETEALPLMKQELLERTENNEPIKPIAVVKKVLEKDYQASEESEIMLKDMGIDENDEIASLAISRNLEKCKLVLDEDVEVVLNVEDYVNGTKIDKVDNGDGTTSLVLKNIKEIVVK